MLRRTVTVGKKYALYLWTGYLTILSLLIATFLGLAMANMDWTVVAYIVVGWAAAGLAVSTFALFQIEHKAAQIKADMVYVRQMQRNLLRRYGPSRKAE